MSELLTCPFCGNEAEFHIYGMTCLVECSECRIGTTIHLIDNYEDVIEKWDTRAERTCEMEQQSSNVFDTRKCSSCGEIILCEYLSELRYCPNCGAKVIK